MKRLTILLLAGLLVACSGGETGDGLTRIRFMNLIEDSDRVLFQAEESSFPVLDFQGGTAYQRFGGTYSFDLELINPDNTFTTLVEDRVLTVDGDNGWTFVAVGSVAAPEFFPVIAANGEPAAGSAKVQIVNATPESLTVTVYAAGQFGAGNQLSSAIGPRAYVDPVEITAQSVQLRVERSDMSIAFDSTPFDLASLDELTFVVTDYVGAGAAVSSGEVLRVDFTGIPTPLETTGRQATVRYVHALTNLPDATVTRTDSLQASTDTDVSFAAASARDLVDPDDWGFSIAPTGNPGAPVYDTSETLSAGFEYSLVFHGDLGAPDSFLLLDDTRPVASGAKISFIHAAPGLAIVDIFVAEVGAENISGTVFAGVAYPSMVPISTPGEARKFTVVTSGTTDIVAGPLELSLADGAVETLLLHDAPTGGEPYDLKQL